MQPTPARAPHLSRICLRVRDPGRSVEFYRTVLGLDSTQLAAGGNGNTVIARQRGGVQPGFEVVFTEGLPPGDHLTGLDRISFEVPSREFVDRIYEEALKCRAQATQPRLYEGHWQTFIFDPDGYKVEVFSRAPGSVTRSPDDQG